MTSLPQKKGPLTLMRRTGSDGITEAYAAILDDPPGLPAVARRILPVIAEDPGLLAVVRARVADLASLRAAGEPPVRVRGLIEADGDLFVVEEGVEAPRLDVLLAGAKSRGAAMPPEVLLHLAVNLCNALEAMHGRPGPASGAEHVLHLQLAPDAIFVLEGGALRLDNPGLLRSPTLLPPTHTATQPMRFEYLTPEQIKGEQISPPTDLFVLGAILAEMATGRPLFKGEFGFDSLHLVQKADVGRALVDVAAAVPGLDRVLSRVLSVNAKNRHPAAFVLREDLRGLMAGYSFAGIQARVDAWIAAAIGAPALSTPALSFDDPPVGAREDASDAPSGGKAFRELDPADLPVARAGDPDESGFGRTLLPPDDFEGMRLPTDEVPTSGGVPGDQTNWFQHPRFAAGAADSETPGMTWIPDDEDLEASSLSAAPTAPPSPPPAAPRAAAMPRPAPTLSPEDDVPPAKKASAHPTISPDDEAPAPKKAGPYPTISPDESSDDEPEIAIVVNKPRPAPTLSPPDEAPRAGATLSPPDELGPPQKRPSAATFDMDLDNGPSTSWEQDPRGEPDVTDPVALAPAPVPTLPVAAGNPSAVTTMGRDGAAKTATPAPQAKRATPAPAPKASFPPPEDDESLPPRSSGNGAMLAVVAAGVALLAVLVCAGGGGTALLGALTFGAKPAAPPVDVARALDAAATPGPATADPAGVPTPPSPTTETTGTNGTDASADAGGPTSGAPAAVDTEPVRRPSLGVNGENAGGSSFTATRVERPSQSAVVPPVRPPAKAWVADVAPPPVEPAPEPIVMEYQGDLGALASKAKNGRLGEADRAYLEGFDAADPDYTRAYVVLYQDAKAREDDRARSRYMKQLMAVPENQYNPQLIVEEAELLLRRKEWDQALEKANLAERHWARLPSDLVFSRKAMIHEIQAGAWQGRFYASEGEDVLALQQAIKAWERYKRHVETRSRSDLATKADRQLEKLNETLERIE